MSRVIHGYVGRGHDDLANTQVPQMLAKLDRVSV